MHAKTGDVFEQKYQMVRTCKLVTRPGGKKLLVCNNQLVCNALLHESGYSGTNV